MSTVVTYIGHSGAMIETDKVTLLFDCIAPVICSEEDRIEASKKTSVSSSGNEYARGELPEISKEKPLLVFVSHKHGDHYERDIWKLRNIHPNVRYIISKDVPFSVGARTRLGITDEELKLVYRVNGFSEIELSTEDLKPKNNSENDAGVSGIISLVIETVPSTDEGVGFFVTLNGLTVFHPGDLNLWTWAEGDGAYIEKMRFDYYKAMEPLKGRECDIAFPLLDPRMEDTRYEGIDAVLSLMNVKNAFPIHMWKDYGLIDEYIKDRADAANVKCVRRIERENQRFIIENK